MTKRQTKLQQMLTTALLIFVLAVAAVDLLTHRIPNVLVGSAVCVGLGLQLWIGGSAGLIEAALGFATGLALLLPFYIMRAFGAGDVKAMAAVGTFLGPMSTLGAVGATLIAGGLIGTFVLLKRSTTTGAAMFRVLGVLTAPFARMSSSTTALAPADRFPYGVAIAIGSACAAFWPAAT